MTDITRLLEKVRRGEDGAEEALLEALYEELHALAGRHMRGQRPGHTLQATALVSEAWMRLVHEGNGGYGDRGHFLAAASRAMRSVLVDHARRRNADKRAAPGRAVPLDGVLVCFEERALDLESLDAALRELEVFDPTMARAVELRFFGGMGMGELADALGMSKRTVERRWTATKAWLRVRVG